MDRNFLKEIAEGYLVNHNVYSEFQESQISTIYETIYEELKTVVDYIYEVDNETYEYVKDLSKIQQQRIFDTYLDAMYAKDETIEEDRGMFGSAAAATWEFFKNKIGDAWGFIADKSFYFQGSLAIILMIFIYRKREPISRRSFQFLAELGKISERIGEFLKKKGRFSRFRYAVIQENSQNCYRKCGIKNLRKDISVSDYFNRHASDEGSVNAKCLADCYIHNEIKKVRLMTKMYFICLRQTGNFDRIKDMNSDKMFELLSSGGIQTHRQHNFGFGSSCVEYFDLITEGMENINTLVEYFYADMNQRREMIMLAQKDIDNVKRKVSNMGEQELRNFTT